MKKEKKNLTSRVSPYPIPIQLYFYLIPTMASGLFFLLI